jgi:ComF family protein
MSFLIRYLMLSTLAQGIKELVFPDNCVLCRAFLNSRHERQLCEACLHTVEYNVPPFCAACSRHLEHFTDDGVCAICRKQERQYDRAWAVCFYNEPMRQLLHSFKYNGKTSLRKTFIPLIRKFIDTYHLPMEDFDCVVPVPLHPVRLRERGFNQSALLSEALCRHYHLNHQPKALIRQRPTATQTTLDQKQRWTNLEGAFRMSPSESVVEKSVLLVDDLLTTGATANAAATALKDSGAAYVGILTLAITG